MRYAKFVIQNYKGIEGPLEVDVGGNPLIPLIGVNECGKTTILQAIFSFDSWNDILNKNIKQLDDTGNLYQTSPKPSTVTASIRLSKKDLTDCLKDSTKGHPEFKAKAAAYKTKIGAMDNELVIQIERNLNSKKYNLILNGCTHAELNHYFSIEIVRQLPYILFFDDFKDSVDDRIEITGSKEEPEGWLAIIQRLFEETGSDLNVFDLPGKEERARKVILSRVNRKLETTLTREWRNFRLEDNKDALTIKLDYKNERTPEGQDRHYLRFDVIEQDAEGQEYFFYIKDRSKGFYWFFNFVMKLEFNPKMNSSDGINAIYLLDEPGSYLHASAQTKLCNKLKQLSERNTVIYCTHSHYLLNPDIIPINSIRVASKDAATFKIGLDSIFNYESDIKDRKSAFQPIIDALEIKPFLLDLTSENVVITEGIYDHYCFEMLTENRETSFVPGTSADSIRYLISLMIGWRINYRALWDNDDEGRHKKAEAEKFFGEGEAAKFFLIPLTGRGKARKLQDLFAGNDLTLIRTDLGIPSNTTFNKTILGLYYSSPEQRAVILNKISEQTKQNFKDVISLLT